MSIGVWELMLILAIVFVLFGAGKLPQVMKDLGQGVKSLKDGLKGDQNQAVQNPAQASQSDQSKPAQNQVVEKQSAQSELENKSNTNS